MNNSIRLTGEFPSVITMGGYATMVTEDQYTDGTPCYVASHPSLEDCVAYGDTPQEALRLLEISRAVCVADVSHNGGRTINQPHGVMIERQQRADVVEAVPANS